MSSSGSDRWRSRPVRRRSRSSRTARAFGDHPPIFPPNSPSSSSGSPPRRVNTGPSLLSQQLRRRNPLSTDQPPPPQYLPMIVDVLETCLDPYQRKEIFVHQLQQLQRYPVQQGERDTSSPEWISQLRRVIQEQEMDIARIERVIAQNNPSGAQHAPSQYIPMIANVFNAFPYPHQRKDIFVNELRRLERYPAKENERDNTTSEWIRQLKQVIREQEIEIAKYDQIPKEDKRMAAAFAQKMMISSQAADMDNIGAGGAASAAAASSQTRNDIKALIDLDGSGDVGREVARPTIGRMANTPTTRAGKRPSTDSTSGSDAGRPPAGPPTNRIFGRAEPGRPPRVPSIERSVSRNLSGDLQAVRSSSGRLTPSKRYLVEEEAGPSIGRNLSDSDI